jgi:hypothetical protein
MTDSLLARIATALVALLIRVYRLIEDRSITRVEREQRLREGLLEAFGASLDAAEAALARADEAKAARTRVEPTA